MQTIAVALGALGALGALLPTAVASSVAPRRFFAEGKHTVHNLSVPRGAMSAAGYDGDTACFGGGGIAGSPKGTPPCAIVDCLNTTTGVWRTYTMPHARGGSSTSGGWLSGPGVSFFGAGGGDSGTVDLLARGGTWLDSLHTTLDHEFTACAGTGSVLACAGGQGHVKNDTHVPSATDVWTLDAAGSLRNHSSAYVLSEPRKKLSAAAQGSVIAFAMGYSDTKAKGTGYSQAFDLLDTATMTWTSGELPSHQGRQYGTAVGCGGMLLFGGGQKAGGRSAAVDIYDTATGRWSNATLTVARSNLAAACAKGRYAVFAGGQIPGRATVDVFDTSAKEWGVLQDLNYGRGWVSGASAGACAVFGGGDRTPGHSSVDAYCF